MFTLGNNCESTGNTSGYSLARCPIAVTRALMLILAVLTLVVQSGSARAQRFRSIAPKLDDRAARTLRGKAAAALRNAAAFQNDGKQVLDSYFKTWYFPQMTQTSPEDLTELGKMRETLVKALRGASVAPAQAHLTALALDITPKIARNTFHPAVRYNAVLVLSMLDKQYAVGGTDPQPPVVLPAATEALLELLEQSEFKGVKVHPAVKVGALEGLERHLRFGMESQYFDRVTQAAMTILDQEPTALGVDADVNNWLKCKAAGLIARLQSASPSAEFHAKITELIDDDSIDLAERCCLAGLLDKLTYTAGTGIDPSSAVLSLGKLTQDVVAEGADKAREFEETMLGNAPGRRGGFGRNAEGPKFERRELMSCLQMIEKGAESVGKGLADVEKQKIQVLTELMEPVLKITASKKAIDLDITEKVLELEDSVNRLVASWTPEEASPAAVDEEFAE